MRLVYNILFVLFFWLSAPYYFLRLWRRGHWQTGFNQRFAHYESALRTTLAQRPVFWLHAVSVGEVGVCCQLLRQLQPHLSAYQILVSTTTSTGMAELQRLLPAEVLRIYYPTDFLGVVRRAFSIIRPQVIVLVEAELWPNFLHAAVKTRCPFFLVNARISEKSLRNYSRFGFIFRPLFARFTGVGCQEQDDAPRLARLGFNPARVQVTGNLKFDSAQPGENKHSAVSDLLDRLDLAPDRLILVAGSTHAGEEMILVKIAQRLLVRFPSLFLILVPRHAERCGDVARELNQLGVKYNLRSHLSQSNHIPLQSADVLLVDSTGELKQFYAHATIVFIGKTLTARGGQNPIEPAALGLPVIFGPNMQNFASVTKAFLRAQAALQVADEAELEKTLAGLLSNPAQRQILGERAFQIVQQNLGATARTVDLILQNLPPNPSASQI